MLYNFEFDTMETIEKKLRKAGINEKDISTICRLEADYDEDCQLISDECVEEGYPAYGSNYEIRCESRRKGYDEEINLILESYEYKKEEK